MYFNRNTAGLILGVEVYTAQLDRKKNLDKGIKLYLDKQLWCQYDVKKVVRVVN